MLAVSHERLRYRIRFYHPSSDKFQKITRDEHGYWKQFETTGGFLHPHGEYLMAVIG